MAENTTFTPAKRGWIAVATSYSRVYNLHTGVMNTRRLTVGTVESITRDGLAKRVLPADSGRAMTPRDWHEIVVLDPAKLADPAGFLAECKARQTPDPETFRPFDDMNDVRATARKYRA